MILDELIQDKQKIGIAGHIGPDGDCVGSTLGLYNYIVKKYPKKEVYIYLEEYKEALNFLKNSDKIKSEINETDFDLFFLLDTASIDRIGIASEEALKAKMKVCIDHHITNNGYADVNIIMPNSSSASEIIYELINYEKTGENACSLDNLDNLSETLRDTSLSILDKDISECLYLGIVHDTGVFQYSCTSMRTMNIAGILMSSGINFPKIVNDTFFAKTRLENKVSSYVVYNSKIYLDGELIIGVITKQDIDKFNIKKKDTTSIVANLRNTIGCEIAAFLYETDDGFKVSLRAKNDIDVAAIAAKYGGGGHKKAAGFTMDKSVDEITQMLIDEMKFEK